MLRELKRVGQVKVRQKLDMKKQIITESQLTSLVRQSLTKILVKEDDGSSMDREQLNDYIKSMIGVYRGSEDFDSTHEIEIDYWNGPTKKRNITINLTVEVPNTGSKEFDDKITKEYAKHLVSKMNEEDSNPYSFREKRPIDLISVEIN